MRFLSWTILILAITVWTAAVLAWGPRLEAAWFPPVDKHPVDFYRSGQELIVNYEATKLRNCNLVSITGGWVFSTGVAMPTVVLRPDGEELPMRPTAAFASGDQYRTGPYTVRIWAMVDADPGAQFRLLHQYHCHFLWDVTVAVMLPMAEVPTRTEQ